MVTNTIESADILSRLDVPMTKEAAEWVLQWKFTDDAVERMNELAERARQGRISDEELLSIDTFERVNNLLGIIKSRARQFLKSQTTVSTSS